MTPDMEAYVDHRVSQLIDLFSMMSWRDTVTHVARLVAQLEYRVRELELGARDGGA